MAEHNSLVGLIVAFPLLGAIINGLLGAIPWRNFPRIPAAVAGILATSLVFLSFIVSIVLKINLSSIGGHEHFFEHFIFSWITVGDFQIPFQFNFDALSGALCLVVTGIGFLIHVYSIGYMHDDENPQRYFTYLNLFTAAMLILVLGANLPVLFIGWEGVGLCSYLLIGFWFEDIEKAIAGKKAFVVNRIGDLGFLLGMFLLFYQFHTLDFEKLKSLLAGFSPEVGFGILTVTSICLFIGATGKSAQIPLFIWLPDAMAGPTPVSALIHAATMVTAGVYMTCRLGILYNLTPITGEIIAVIAVCTAFVSATIAIVQNDIKKVLAYSTVSQLGYMFLGVGVGAYMAAVFHLITHAFFKALMFLGSGSVIHAMGGEQDIRKMGGLKQYMPITYITFGIGTLAIAGIPIFSGFFSKDEILWQTISSPKGNSFIYLLALLTAGLTAVYMGRLFCLTFLGSNRSSPEVKKHLHESPYVMTVPLIILAVLAAVGGFLGFPHIFGGETIPNILEHSLEGVVPMSQGVGSTGQEFLFMFISVLAGAGGLFFAYWFYITKNKGLAESKSNTRDFLFNSYYLNEFYEYVFVRPLYSFAMFLWKIVDVIVIDGAVLFWAQFSRWSGTRMRTIQTGDLEQYLAVFLLGLLVIVFLALGRVFIGV